MNAIQQLLTEHIAIWTAADTEKKTGRGRSSGNAASVYGIRKLRELILELAVRGKLVPQDANDEPASALLKRIQAEKAKLLAEGKIKKDKPLPPITAEEKPFELPNGWVWTTLASVSLVNPRNNVEDNLPASFVPMTMIGSRFNSSHDHEARRWKEIKQGFTHIAEGDIGVAKITPCFENSKACVFSGLLSGIGAGTTELHIVRPINATLAPRYVLAYLKSPQFLLVGETKMTGTAGQKRLPKEFLESNPFPLPPLAEQHRIIAKVDELMALCDQLETRHNNAAAAHEKLMSHLLGTLTHTPVRPELVEGRGSTGSPRTEFEDNWQRIAAHFDTLFTTEASIDALKQTLLQLAVMGKLVPQDPNDEPASVLLKRIQAEKARLVAEGKIKNKSPSIPLLQRGKTPSAASAPPFVKGGLGGISEDENPFALPRGWHLASFSELGEFSGGKTPNTSRSEYWNGDIPWVTPKDMKSSLIVETEDHVSYKAVEDGLAIIPPRSILIVVRSGILRRTVPVAINAERCTVNQDLKVLQLVRPEMAEYIRLMVQGFEQFIMEKLTKIGTTVESIKFDEFSTYQFPLPPLAEQHRIVAKVDELMALCDQLKTRLTADNQLQQKLADVVVEQAIA